MDGKFTVNGKIVRYEIKDIEEPLTKNDIRRFNDIVGGKMILKTNAGLDLHSSELNGNYWNDIKIERL